MAGLPNRFNNVHKPLDFVEILKEIQAAGWSINDIAKVTGLSCGTITNYVKDRTDIPAAFNQAIILLDLYVRTTHNKPLPEL